ncbi:DUF397 domain-containing protein [Streptomyces roseolus]|uniref:DUF397 domain-containing protein n=1 Tax=Streptomyces roseolus TaxID=67358 RepID=UPI0036EBFEC1
MTDRTIPNAAALSGWRKSSYSSGDGGSCVEVLDGYQSGVPVRDSKTPDGPALVFTRIDWSSFVASLKGGSFSNRLRPFGPAGRSQSPA